MNSREAASACMGSPLSFPRMHWELGTLNRLFFEAKPSDRGRGRNHGSWRSNDQLEKVRAIEHFSSAMQWFISAASSVVWHRPESGPSTTAPFQATSSESLDIPRRLERGRDRCRAHGPCR